MQHTFLSSKWLFTSVVIAGLACSASLLGIFDPAVYEQETANWAVQAKGQDIGNLVAVPVLLLSLLLFSKKVASAFSLWLGSMFYFIYAYLVYSFAVHFNYLFLVYVGILGLSIYSVVGVLIENRSRLEVPRKFTSIFFASTVLMVTGSLFLLLWLSDIIPALFTNRAPASMAITGLWVNPIHVIDLSMVLPGMILAGIWLWQKKTLGFVLAIPWLVFSALMGSSIVATMVMELEQGNQGAVVPLVMVGTIVILSVVASLGLLKSPN